MDRLQAFRTGNFSILRECAQPSRECGAPVARARLHRYVVRRCQNRRVAECKHGIEESWCGTCSGADDAGRSGSGSYGFHGGETKQDVVDDICDLLGMPRLAVSVGSSVPSEIFLSAARLIGVPVGSMPEIGEAIVRRAGDPWLSTYDSRGTLSGGGSTVTLEGLQAVRRALKELV